MESGPISSGCHCQVPGKFSLVVLLLRHMFDISKFGFRTVFRADRLEHGESVITTPHLSLQRALRAVGHTRVLAEQQTTDGSNGGDQSESLTVRCGREGWELNASIGYWRRASRHDKLLRLTRVA